MQGNTKRINVNHWMEVNTNGGMDELVTWIKGPTFRMKKRPTDLKPPWESNTTPSIIQWRLIQRLGRKSQAGRPHLGRPAWGWPLSTLRCTDMSINGYMFLLKLVWVLILSFPVHSWFKLILPSTCVNFHPMVGIDFPCVSLHVGAAPILG